MGDIIDFTNFNRQSYLRYAYLLAIITIGYNVLEGLVSIFFGFEDETLSLFGFGLDSFVEVVSGIGILHMIMRMRDNPEVDQDRFEQRALKITGNAFYVLSIGLVITAAVNLVQSHNPKTTVWGIIIGSISIVTMAALIYFKKKVGNSLNSEAILADANCTKACLYLSFILLAASLGYEFTGIGHLDSLGALWIAWYAFREGREAFEKASGESCSCDRCAS